ncbi:MAG: hypothetical protein R3A78_16880 [Polyangiales bacterium]|nr:hypothetical protein [Myxococcales bacterium]
MWKRLPFVVLLGCLLAVPSVAAAKQTQNFEYRFSQVWSSAYRLIRVDMACRITDRDDEIGFLMFEYSDGRDWFPGSAQLVQVKERGKDVIRVEVQIPEQPSYIEIMILDKLRKKLLEEYGEPIVGPTPGGKRGNGPSEEPPSDKKGKDGEAPNEPGNRNGPKDGERAPKQRQG